MFYQFFNDHYYDMFLTSGSIGAIKNFHFLYKILYHVQNKTFLFLLIFFSFFVRLALGTFWPSVWIPPGWKYQTYKVSWPNKIDRPCIGKLLKRTPLLRWFSYECFTSYTQYLLSNLRSDLIPIGTLRVQHS